MRQTVLEKVEETALFADYSAKTVSKFRAFDFYTTDSFCPTELKARQNQNKGIN